MSAEEYLFISIQEQRNGYVISRRVSETPAELPNVVPKLSDPEIYVARSPEEAGEMLASLLRHWDIENTQFEYNAKKQPAQRAAKTKEK